MTDTLLILIFNWGIRSCDGRCSTISPAYRSSCSTEICHFRCFESKLFSHFSVKIALYFHSWNSSVVGQVNSLSFFWCGSTFFFRTAWTTAAVDNERVIGAMPIVMDILNLNQVNHLIDFHHCDIDSVWNL